MVKQPVMQLGLFAGKPTKRWSRRQKSRVYVCSRRGEEIETMVEIRGHCGCGGAYKEAKEDT